MFQKDFKSIAAQVGRPNEGHCPTIAAPGGAYLYLSEKSAPVGRINRYLYRHRFIRPSTPVVPTGADKSVS